MTEAGLFAQFLETAIQELRVFSAGLPDNPAYKIGAPIKVRTDNAAEATAFARWNFDEGGYEIVLTLGLCVWAFEVAAIVAMHTEDGTAVPLAGKLDFSNHRHLSHDDLMVRAANAAQHLPRAQHGYFEYVFGCILLAIFQHELAHILAGHIDYLKSVPRSDALIDELHILTIKRKAYDDVPPVLFEYEADHVGSQLLAEAAASSSPPLSRWTINTRQENTVIGLLGFTLFTIATEETTRLQNMKAPGYPSPMLRFAVAVTGAKRIWDEDHPGEEFRDAVMLPLGDALILFEGAYPAVGFLRDFTDPDWQQNLHSEIDALLDKCQPYAGRVAPFSLME